MFSIGLFSGNFRHPQKSELYNKIGFTKESNKEMVVDGCNLKKFPILFLSICNALIARSRRSVSALLISPEGVNRSPRYLYELVVSTVFPLRA